MAESALAYDVRGAGESSCPASRSGYRFDQLVSDIDAVIDSLGVGRVHVLAHDWGSIQAWPAVTDDAVIRSLRRALTTSRSTRGFRDISVYPAQVHFCALADTPRQISSTI